MKLQMIVASLKRERNQTQNKLEQLDAALAALGAQTARAARFAGIRQAKARKPMSAAARRRIAAAQRARWAKWKAAHSTKKR